MRRAANRARPGSCDFLLRLERPLISRNTPETSSQCINSQKTAHQQYAAFEAANTANDRAVATAAAGGAVAHAASHAMQHALGRISTGAPFLRWNPNRVSVLCLLAIVRPLANRPIVVLASLE
jgi:hypothetical protein